MSVQQKVWTKQEIAMLKEHYPNMGAACGDLFGRSYQSCTKAAQRYGVKRIKKTIKRGAKEGVIEAWTEEEIALLRKHYPKMGTSCREMFGRSKSSVVGAAMRHGIQYVGMKKLKVEHQVSLKNDFVSEDENKGSHRVYKMDSERNYDLQRDMAKFRKQVSQKVYVQSYYHGGML